SRGRPFSKSRTALASIDVERAERDLAVQFAVTDVLATSTTPEAAARAILPRVGRTLGWLAGDVWLVDEDAGVLRCVAAWTTSAHDDLAGENAQFTFPP